MAKAITVMVVDKKGNGLYGHKVKYYGQEASITDKDGCVTLVIRESSTSIYVDGSTVYKGSISDCPNPLVVSKG